MLKLLVTTAALRLFRFAPHFDILRVRYLRLIEFVLGGIAVTALGDASGFPGSLINQVLHKNCELDADPFRIFNDLPMAKDGIHLGSSHLFSVLT